MLGSMKRKHNMITNHRTIDYLVVHCSATQPKSDIGAVELDRMHRERGFFRSKPVGNLNLTGIGYHYVIRRNGSVEKGRDDSEVGAHVEGHNSHSIGICLVGGIDAHGKAENNYTLEQMHTLATLLATLRESYPKAKIWGHRDFPKIAKDCPCFDVRAWLTNTCPHLA